MITVQITSKSKNLPTKKQFIAWAEFVLKKTRQKNRELVIRIVDKKESHFLNKTFRHKDKPTNILSFPFESPLAKTAVLGDIVICAPIIKAEAREQKKLFTAHWAHMVTHGILHLLGYDHIKKAEAHRMEALEIRILAELGYTNPYEENDYDNGRPPQILA